MKLLLTQSPRVWINISDVTLLGEVLVIDQPNGQILVL